MARPLGHALLKFDDFCDERRALINEGQPRILFRGDPVTMDVALIPQSLMFHGGRMNDRFVFIHQALLGGCGSFFFAVCFAPLVTRPMSRAFGGNREWNSCAGTAQTRAGLSGSALFVRPLGFSAVLSRMGGGPRAAVGQFIRR